MSSYTTSSGDMWDAISFKAYGTCDYAGKLMTNNSDYIHEYVFPAGVVLRVPEVEGTEELLEMLPPWRR
jgi:phage tail protein X